MLARSRRFRLISILLYAIVTFPGNETFWKLAALIRRWNSHLFPCRFGKYRDDCIRWAGLGTPACGICSFHLPLHLLRTQPARRRLSNSFSLLRMSMQYGHYHLNPCNHSWTSLFIEQDRSSLFIQTLPADTPRSDANAFVRLLKSIASIPERVRWILCSKYENSCRKWLQESALENNCWQTTCNCQ